MYLLSKTSWTRIPAFSIVFRETLIYKTMFIFFWFWIMLWHVLPLHNVLMGKVHISLILHFYFHRRNGAKYTNIIIDLQSCKWEFIWKGLANYFLVASGGRSGFVYTNYYNFLKWQPSMLRLATGCMTYIRQFSMVMPTSSAIVRDQPFAITQFEWGPTWQPL